MTTVVNELDEWYVDPNFSSEGDEFGRSVAFSDNVAVVGARGVDDKGRGSGAAYIWQRIEGASTPTDPTDDDWVQVDTLYAEFPAANDGFGSSVAITGNDVDGYTIVVGSPGGDGNARDTGTICVYDFDISDGRTDPITLSASDGAKGDGFGGERALSISGDTIVVGARGHDEMGTPHTGAAYVFEKVNGVWNETTKLNTKLDTELSQANDFGSSVAVSGTTIAVGARAGGTVYVFENDGTDWTEKTRLTRLDGGTLGFDVSVSATQDTIVASAIWSAYVFEREGTSWQGHSGTELTRLRPSDGPSDADDDFRFGWSVDIHEDAADPTNDTIVVGAISHPAGGAAYTFARNPDEDPAIPGDEWKSHTTLVPQDDNDDVSPSGVAANVGFAVATDGVIVLAADNLDDAEGTENAGSVYVFPRDPLAPSPGINVTPTSGLQTSEDGLSDTFSVVLNTQPVADVTVGLSVDAAGADEVQLDQNSLIFRSDNWNTPQTVTVTGQDDGDVDGSQSFVVITAAAVSADLDYDGLDPADVTGTNLDNEVPPTTNTVMYAWSIESQIRQRGKNTDLRLIVDVNQDSNDDGLANSTDAALANALVTIELFNTSGGSVGTYSGITDAEGFFHTDWIRGLDAGDYSAEIVDLVLAEYDWIQLPGITDDSDGDNLPDEVWSI